VPRENRKTSAAHHHESPARGVPRHPCTMNNKNPDWNRVFEMLTIPLVFFAVYTAGEAGLIAAIALGVTDSYALVKIGWVIGLLCGWLIMYLLFVRPKNKMLDNYRELTADMIQTLHEQQDLLLQMQKKRRIEGDEWKDG